LADRKILSLRPKDLDSSGGWQEEPGEMLDQRGLAGAVLTDQEHIFSDVDIERDPFQGRSALRIAIMKIVSGKDRVSIALATRTGGEFVWPW
jgi:hypothetical protein